jgi:beta-carotene 3-hydroxylase
MSTGVSVLAAGAAFVVMEPVTYLTHRFVMHGVGERLHRSHHRRTHGRLELNDLYPVMFAAVVCTGLAAGFNIPRLHLLVAVGVGITLYGLAYALVHDGYIHRRLGRVGARRTAVLDRLADAHQIHHRFNNEPYGMLMPVVPQRLRQRASGSVPSQVPLDA